MLTGCVGHEAFQVSVLKFKVYVGGARIPMCACAAGCLHLVDVVAGNHHKGRDVGGCTARQTRTLQGGGAEVEHLNLASDARQHCRQQQQQQQEQQTANARQC